MTIYSIPAKKLRDFEWRRNWKNFGQLEPRQGEQERCYRMRMETHHWCNPPLSLEMQQALNLSIETTCQDPALEPHRLEVWFCKLQPKDDTIAMILNNWGIYDLLGSSNRKVTNTNHIAHWFTYRYTLTIPLGYCCLIHLFFAFHITLPYAFVVVAPPTINNLSSSSFLLFSP